MFPSTPVPSSCTYWDLILRTGDDGRETQSSPSLVPWAALTSRALPS